MIRKVLVINVGVGNSELLMAKFRYWTENGINITMLCPTYCRLDFRQKEIKIIGIEQAKIVTNKHALIAELLVRNIFGWRLIKKLDLHQTTVYSISSVLDELLIPYFLKLSGKKFRWTALFENEVYFRRKGNLITRFLASIFYRISLVLLRKVDVIYAISPKLKEVLISYGIRKEKIIVTGNAVEEMMIRRALSKRLPRSGGIFMGRIDENKGVYDLFEAMKIIIKKHPEFVLKIAGGYDSSILEKLSYLSRENGLTNNIKFPGFLRGNIKYNALAGSELFLFPSYYESFGLALLEAVCSGCKAVAYDLPEYRWIYPKGAINVVPRGDVVAFAKAVIELLDNNKIPNTEQLIKKYNYKSLALLEAKYF